MPVSAHDCVVVGAGPAGAWAARCLASSGIDTLVLERREEVVDEASTATAISPAALRLLPPLPDELVDGWARRIRVGAGERPEFRVDLAPRDALAVVETGRLLERLRRMAREAGAEIRTGCEVTGFDLDDAGLVVETDRGGYRASVVIGADGADGLTGRTIRRGETGRALGVRLAPGTEAIGGPGRSRPGAAVFEIDAVPGGVAWWIVGRRIVAAGAWSVGGDDGALRDGLLAFLARRGLDPETVAERRLAGPRPVARFRPDEPLTASRFLLVGAAAGLVDPLTGESLRWALESAGLAARTVVHHFRRAAPLEAYGEAVRASCYPDLLPAAGLADAVQALPRLAHRIVAGLPRVDGRLQDLAAGRLRYEDALRAYRARPLFRLLMLAGRVWPRRGGAATAVP